MRRKKGKIIGLSYAQRVYEINRIYDEHCHSGLSNREILRQYIWPKYHICERSFYNMINAVTNQRIADQMSSMSAQLTLGI